MRVLEAAMVMMALSSAPAWAASCSEELGLHPAQKLVDRCLQVSPATHPPCNVENSCDMIEDEISRSCELLGDDAPAWCRPRDRED